MLWQSQSELLMDSINPRQNINYELLETLQDKLPDVGLVLHGGTGVSDEDMKRCAKGMKKINVGTELNKSYIEEVNASFPDATPFNIFYESCLHRQMIISNVSSQKNPHCLKCNLFAHETMGICITESDNT